MAIRCENCSQPLLEDDTVCWQCGHQVSGVVASESDATSVKEKWSETSATSDVSALAVYGGVTVVLIVLALAVTIYLGRQPLVQAASQRPPDGWAYVSNLRRDFTFMLPEEWALFDFDDSDAEVDPFSQLLATNPELTQATNPLGEEAEDLYVIFVATSERPETGELPEQFLVVAHSNILNDLSAEQAIALAEAGEVDLVEATYVDNFAKSHVFLEAIIPTETGDLSCRQQFVTGVSFSLIVAVCGPDRQMQSEILNSFQRLSE